MFVKYYFPAGDRNGIYGASVLEPLYQKLPHAWSEDGSVPGEGKYRVAENLNVQGPVYDGRIMSRPHESLVIVQVSWLVRCLEWRPHVVCNQM